ncbi:hypothetical protein V8F20_008444 [Naviculisporaceae sp. PSN 640]
MHGIACLMMMGLAWGMASHTWICSRTAWNYQWKREVRRPAQTISLDMDGWMCGWSRYLPYTPILRSQVVVYATLWARPTSTKQTRFIAISTSLRETEIHVTKKRSAQKRKLPPTPRPVAGYRGIRPREPRPFRKEKIILPAPAFPLFPVITSALLPTSGNTTSPSCPFSSRRSNICLPKGLAWVSIRTRSALLHMRMWRLCCPWDLPHPHTHREACPSAGQPDPPSTHTTLPTQEKANLGRTHFGGLCVPPALVSRLSRLYPLDKRPRPGRQKYRRETRHKNKRCTFPQW